MKAPHFLSYRTLHLIQHLFKIIFNLIHNTESLYIIYCVIYIHYTIPLAQSILPLKLIRLIHKVPDNQGLLHPLL